MRIYFGPTTTAPSWYWVGFDVARFLSQEHDIRFFSDINDIPDDAVVFWVKCALESESSEQVLQKRLRIVFFPVDVFQDVEHIVRCRGFTDACALIVVHSPSLGRFFSKNRVRFVDHYNKYGITSRERVPRGALLWIGGYQYFPYVLRYVLENNLHRRRKISYLTDYRSPNAIAAANRLGYSLGLGIDFSDRAQFNDFDVIEWSESNQAKLLLTCAGAFDYKDTQNFNQIHKPPTKIQKFVCSNIPFAMNGDSSLRSSLGFEICDILDEESWLSWDYQMIISEFGSKLRNSLTLATIAAKYIQFAEEAQAGAHCGSTSRGEDAGQIVFAEEV
jgi:hypothetical protein